MFERIGRSWELVKASGRILLEDKKLLVFPVISGIVTILVVISFILPLLLTGVVLGTTRAGPAWLLYLFLFYVVSYFVVIFFNTGLITCVNARLQGRDTTISDGISHAIRHIGSILIWAVIAATVGMILRTIQNRSGTLGRIAIAIAGGIWSLVTMFVIPVLVLEDKGVVDAMKESVALFRKTWGESVVGSFSIGLIFGAIVAVGLLFVFAALSTGSIAVMILAVALFLLLIAIVSVVSSAMQGIFVTALYMYAKTGNVPASFDRGLIEGAFVPKGGQGFQPGNI
ncbi:MAG: DUF6159 family protein [Methanomicrobiales archaeon]|nr:DUF6159 family protein [Methanomicrobiales archaeon]